MRELVTLPETNDAVRFTLERMRRMIRSPGLKTLMFARAFADGPVSHRVLGAWCWLLSVRWYVDDPPGWEIIKQADYSLDEWERTREITGDCDDLCVILGALLFHAGVPVNLVAVAVNPDGLLEHVYLRAFDPEHGYSWALDPSLEEGMGWEVPADEVTARVELEV